MKALFALLRASCVIAAAAVGGAASAQTIFVPGGTLGTSANGNVGIGTNAPGSKLEVLDSSAVRTTPLVLRNEFGTTANQKSVGIAFRGGNGFWAAIYGEQQMANTWSYGRLVFGTRTSDAAGVETKMTLLSSGNLGIGTASPAAKLHVAQAGFLPGTNTAAAMMADGAYGGGCLLKDGTGYAGMWTTDAGASLNISSGGTASGFGSATGQVVLKSGNVGIGTANPAHKLAVNGTIKAKEVIVELTGWADDVFEPGYALASAAQIRRHIDEHGTLPGVPSAEQVAAEGVSVGQMQATLLRKVEELTLHMLRQEEEIVRLRAEVQRLGGSEQTP